MAHGTNASAWRFYRLAAYIAPWIGEDEISADEAEHICIKMQGLDQ